MKTIAIDWDGTFTEIADVLLPFMLKAKEVGHRVIICTMRFEEEAGEIKDLDQVFEVFYTGRKAKMSFLVDLGIDVDIWIDDNPMWIYKDSE